MCNIMFIPTNIKIIGFIAYRIAGYFLREFLFGCFEEAFLFKNRFLITVFLQKLIPTTKINCVMQGFQCTYFFAYLSFQLPDSEKHANSESILALQISRFD